MSIKEEIADILQQSTMTLATCSAEGIPHAAPLYFAADEELACYFFSKNDSLHCRQLSHNPHAAVAIYIEAFDWREIRGLQMRGIAKPVKEESRRQKGMALYQEKFPFVSQLTVLLLQHQLYVFQPEWVRYINNRQKLGYKEEWQIR